ncbi:hypothetical protein CTB91_03809 [Dickeya solani]|uniref:Uncharacterized protein n=1 Tax=Dickeya solani D s0432-1 TaxID=1231725 RepID=A0AAV3K8S6_9GAMM|nr:hypothetical protein CTB91_03809 [Dickeya solani]ERO57158.1 hypothetical protein A544_3734 [Dickeya solani D s0432-1]AYQ53717.1 hypothetical protein DSOL99_03807 [Dickeya solani]NUA40432.1 hypothetical protein [Dickeya solani]NUA43814.1 hypothetical protein [Dickeya solani]
MEKMVFPPTKPVYTPLASGFKSDILLTSYLFLSGSAGVNKGNFFKITA